MKQPVIADVSFADSNTRTSATSLLYQEIWSLTNNWRTRQIDKQRFTQKQITMASVQDHSRDGYLWCESQMHQH